MARTKHVLDHPVTRAVSGTALAAGVVIAVAVSVSALVAPLPTSDARQPVVIDESPRLPSDEEPVGGWPAPAATDDAQADVTTDLDDRAGGTASSPGPGEADSDRADDAGDDLIDDAIGDVTDTVDDLVDDVTDTVDDLTEDAADDVTDTVDDLVDDTTDDASDDASDTLP